MIQTSIIKHLKNIYEINNKLGAFFFLNKPNNYLVWIKIRLYIL